MDEKPTVYDIQGIYGSIKLPATTFVLPLKRDKVEPVKNQLSTIHPELLLFLSKIRRLSVKEAADVHQIQNQNSLSAISISSEKDLVARKSINAESFTLKLLSSEEDKAKECRYFMWRQRFPVRQENRVKTRTGVDDWLITLAFPLGKRLVRGMEAGIYAFLPTEMVTNFPFIIQSDFILQSSREKIRVDDLWNKGILSCVPTAFVDAFTCLVKSNEGASVSTIASVFDLLPLEVSTYKALNAVRESIKKKILREKIVPSESFSSELFFRKPSEVGLISPIFRNILHKANEQGVSFHNLPSHGKCILCNSFDTDNSKVLKFLAVKNVDIDWYSRCIMSSDLVLSVDTNLYVKLLEFLAERWESSFETTTMEKIPLLKYVDKDGDTSLLSIEEAASESGPTLCRSKDLMHASWLIRWSEEFKCAKELYFMPEDVQVLCSKNATLRTWLTHYANVKIHSVYSYALRLFTGSLNRRLVLAFAHFLHHSFSSGYEPSTERVEILSQKFPLINSSGVIILQRNGVIVPANGSKWAQLSRLNPWKAGGYVELHKDYMRKGNFGSRQSSDKEILEFLRKHVGASDVPDIDPPNEALACVSSPLSKVNTFLLLDWIRKLRAKGIQMPSKFLESIKEGSWLRVSLGGSSDYRPPCQSFLHSSSWGSLLQNATVMIDIPIIDQGFYDNKLIDYQEELKAIGVMSTYGEACSFIGDHLMSLADTSCLTRNNAIAMLGLIRFLREKYLSPDTFIASIKKGNWMVTSRGVRSPVDSVLYKESWKTASEVSDIPFIDLNYYGNCLLEYEAELQLLGVVVGEYVANYRIVRKYMKTSNCLNYMTSDALILLLKCLQGSSEPKEVVSVRINHY